MVTWVQADYRTAVGEQPMLTLPDQSRVTLNTQSAIAVSFDAAFRRVRLLKGEALFAVQPDVTGTFNVREPAQSLALLIKTFPLTMVRLTDLVVILF